MSGKFDRDQLVAQVGTGMTALRYVAHQIADLSDTQALPDGLRELVQVTADYCQFHTANLIEWAERAEATARTAGKG